MRGKPRTGRDHDGQDSSGKRHTIVILRGGAQNPKYHTAPEEHPSNVLILVIVVKTQKQTVLVSIYVLSIILSS